MKIQGLKKSIKFFSLSIIFLSVLMTGCTPKNVAYFQDIADETVVVPTQGNLKIAPNDKLTIVVKTMDPSLSALFNLAIVNDRMSESTLSTGLAAMRNNYGNSTGISRYTVSSTGTIDFPVLGELKVAGMTREELAGFIKGELMGKDLAKDPIVTVEFVNAGVSMMGDVVAPGLYNLSQDRTTILEAISMAGDLTLTGKRENVTVLREQEGKINTYKVDLTNFKELSQSPAYYLQQGDVIYVEPNDMKKRQTTTNVNNIYTTGFWISVASLLTSVTTTVGVFVLR